ncbi:hypothetical protein MTBSS4_340005 [Magnetospirillum sp. SS-4]|nr:hypothetical protein MTBSS4_340005 [Magnetospirillum sp. SS-4]
MEMPVADDIPDEIDALKAALAVARAKAADDQALIAHQKLQIEKLNRALYGSRAERTVRLIDQMELTFEDLAATATEDEIAAEQAVAKTSRHVQPDRHRQDERHRSPGLAGRRPRPHRRASGSPDR